MTVQTRISSLEAKHAQLDADIHAAYLKGGPEMDVIPTLKKQKLQIKDELEKLAKA